LRRLLVNCRTSFGIKNILIKDKIIDYIGTEHPVHDELVDCSGLLIIPGMIDAHVHVRDMDQSNKETWETASEAAIAGGVTTIIDMPNTIPATTNLKGLNEKREVAIKAKVNYKFHLGATENNLQELNKILKNNPSDIAGIKIFLAGSSSNEVVADEDKLKEIFQLAKEHKKVVLVHTEMQGCIDKWQKLVEDKCTKNHNMIRNRECSIKGTELVLRLAHEIGNKLYICHVSTKEEIELIRYAKQSNKNIFCEVTPHHLTLTKDILDEVGNIGKVNPPLRAKDDLEQLWKAIADGTIDCIGSDHAPHTIDEKNQEYSQTPSGFPGLETTIPILLTEFQKRNVPIKKFIELISNNAARIFGFKKRGFLNEGYFADLIVLNTDNEQVISTKLSKSKAKYSPFDVMMTKVYVERVFVNGKIYEN